MWSLPGSYEFHHLPDTPRSLTASLPLKNGERKTIRLPIGWNGIFQGRSVQLPGGKGENHHPKGSLAFFFTMVACRLLGFVIKNVANEKVVEFEVPHHKILLMEEIPKQPPGMYKTLQIMGHLPHQLVQFFFHQQYQKEVLVPEKNVNICRSLDMFWRFFTTNWRCFAVELKIFSQFLGNVPSAKVHKRVGKMSSYSTQLTQWYRWWKKSCTSWWVVYPVIT